MLNITVTTSTGRYVFSVASPVEDSVAIVYNDCLYCGHPTTRAKFCCNSHCVLYCKYDLKRFVNNKPLNRIVAKA